MKPLANRSSNGFEALIKSRKDMGKSGGRALFLGLKCFSLALALAIPALAYSSVVPPNVTVRGIYYAGTGCPAGSVSENLSPDFKAFTLIFDSFVAQVGPGVPFSEKRKNCQINVDLNFPSGWSFTVSNIDYRGFASLEPGVIGLQKATYYFQGQRQSSNAGTPFYGPLEKDYFVRDTLSLESAVWSPCGAQRSLNINSQVRLDNQRAPMNSGLLTTDSIDGTFETKLYLMWRPCRAW